jgi:hypothetical protein
VIELIGGGLPPNDDWMPALILENKGSASVFGFTDLDGDEAKDIVANKITEVIAEFKPDTACFITTAWTLEFEKEKSSEAEIARFMSGHLRIRDHPNRIEIVSAYCYGDLGENEGEALMIGYIQRYPNQGPQIKRWKIMDDDITTAEGRFPDAVKDGFKQAKGD